MRYMISFFVVLLVAGCMNPGMSGGASEQPAYETRNIAVLADEPTSLEICDRSCNTVASFSPSWTQTTRGYEATIRVSTEIFYGRSFLKLVTEDGRGWSDWGPGHLDYLRDHDVTADDPACVGGEAWCAVRGL